MKLASQLIKLAREIRKTDEPKQDPQQPGLLERLVKLAHEHQGATRPTRLSWRGRQGAQQAPRSRWPVTEAAEAALNVERKEAVVCDACGGRTRRAVKLVDPRQQDLPEKERTSEATTFLCSSCFYSHRETEQEWLEKNLCRVQLSEPSLVVEE